ncbi:AbiTii domain-containing protein [Mucilaginibacter agri]|uniref:AbiTii domain-containing protein n=1 Tax=Mucilaginibacter agri TaxID=2695265 RepID=A0A966DTZ8_9SPHI|nr:hypothetical protein [Mucilaginibacter agri]NCD71843.1 hypothetical protein [Mucilaginibacter agri]
MQLIEIITNELTDVDLSLTSPLLKTKLLASRIGNQELLAWVSNELNGYKKQSDLPDYRKTTGEIVGDYINGTNIINNHVLPIPSFDSSFDDQIRAFELFDGIEPLEQMATLYTDSLLKPFTQGQVTIFQNLLIKHVNTFGNFSLMSAGVRVPAGALKRVLNAVRNQLLDFMIALETEFGLEVKIETLQSNKQKITTIMNTTINTNGDGNLVNTGTGANITFSATINKGNQEALKKALLENEVHVSDAEDLLAVIDTESPLSSTEFGPKVTQWVYKMIGKAMDNSWKIGVSAAGGVLGKLICHYYGLQ